MEKIIDTHAHYDDEAFENDRYSLLDRLFAGDVKKIVTIGCRTEDFPLTLELAEKYPDIYAAVGIHPEYASEIPENYLSLIKEAIKRKKVVAIGETGLDYHYENYDREAQIKLFRAQIALAEETDLPVIIHSRDATEDTMEILRETRPKKAVLHCFSGSAETAREVVSLGLYVGFTGVLTFKNAKKALAACGAVPLDRLLLETDCPYMSPAPHRGERCDSSLLRFTAEKMAQIKGLRTDEMIRLCNENAERFYDFDR